MKVLLLSGGYDSTALASMERPDLSLTIDYGQLPAAGEIRASREICRELDLRHEVLKVDCRQLGSGDLAGTVPSDLAPFPEWWPFRNQLLVTLCAMRAMQVGADSLIIGTVRTDSFHADGRAEFLEAMNRMLWTQEGHVQVFAPALSMSTVELVRQSGISMELLAWAHSCHVSEWACGWCRGCAKQLEVRIALGHESF